MSKEIEINVNYGRNKTEQYNIYIVPNRFNVDYYEYIKQVNKVVELNNRLQNATDEKELNKIQDEMLGLGLAEILDNKYNLIKTIMIANDYEYNRDFWDLKVDPNDVDIFITQCAVKDKPEQVKKKLLRMLPSITSI